jgi:secreted trypsin-like serine protease
MNGTLKTLLLTSLPVLLAACGGGDGPELPSAQALCGSAGVNPKVVNGASCGQPERTAVVLLEVVSATSVSRCSGTLITPTKILTAAHCIPSSARRVLVGVWSPNGTVTGRNASRWAVHPQYQPTTTVLLNDVAVVVLPSPMPNPTMPVLVSARTAAGQGVYVAGWGAPSFDLAVGFATLSSVNDNSLRYQFNGDLSNTCSGDSGGPVYRLVDGRAAVVGVTSSGSAPNCGDNEASLSTNVQGDAVIPFIRSQAPEASYL